MEVEGGIWKPIKLVRNGSGISHLFFTNDLVLFAWNWEVRVQHVYREGNKVADCMATLAGGKGRGMQLHRAPLVKAMGLLQADERQCRVEATSL
ncbi:hypothetical protein J1N35_024723 [Gossypium stocksii]|uniref:RNase H type-1 domain-containing protein n=1 Tax=Gossypium stocksii TaxID=47602 RepID=A0A9D3V5M7_9ROSI|nr:hypothetical protein J1N35_024723 [Gossypium stocksii]